MAVWPVPRITFRELSAIEETRPVALLTNSAVWSVLNGQLTLPVAIQAEPPHNDRALFDYLATHLPSQVKAIYAVGSGAPVEAGKVVAVHNQLPLVIVPTALDSAEPFLPVARAKAKADGKTLIEQIETGPATEVVIDWSLIESAPAHSRGAGIVDVLAIVTALLDWRHAAQKGQNPREERFKPWAAGVATDLAKQAIKSAAAIGQGEQDALHTLLDLLLTLAQLGNQLEHRRVCRGSEHFLADILDVSSDPTLAHAERVGPCLLFASAAHGQDPAPLREALEAAGVRLDRVRATDFGLILDHLDGYVQRFEFPYSILNDLDPDSLRAIDALHQAGLAVKPETWQEPVARTRSLSPAEEAPHEHKRLVDAGQRDRPAPPATDAEQSTRPAEGANVAVE